jgi:hypothetical protein
MPFRTARIGRDSEGENEMLWAIIAILLLLWLLGFIGSVGGAFIHLLLVIAAVVLVIQLLSGRRGTAL